MYTESLEAPTRREQVAPATGLPCIAPEGNPEDQFSALRLSVAEALRELRRMPLSISDLPDDVLRRLFLHHLDVVADAARAIGAVPSLHRMRNVGRRLADEIAEALVLEHYCDDASFLYACAGRSPLQQAARYLGQVEPFPMWVLTNPNSRRQPPAWFVEHLYATWCGIIGSDPVIDVTGLTKIYVAIGEPYADTSRPHGKPQWAERADASVHTLEILCSQHTPAAYVRALERIAGIASNLSEHAPGGHLCEDLADAALSLFFAPPPPLDYLGEHEVESNASDDDDEESEDSMSWTDGSDVSEEYEDDEVSEQEPSEDEKDEEYCDNPMCCHCACNCRLLFTTPRYSYGRICRVKDETAVFHTYRDEGAEEGLASYIGRFGHGGSEELAPCRLTNKRA